jgi:hypothetical protein
MAVMELRPTTDIYSHRVFSVIFHRSFFFLGLLLSLLPAFVRFYLGLLTAHTQRMIRTGADHVQVDPNLSFAFEQTFR